MSNPQGYPQRLFLLQCRYRDLLHRDHKHIRRPRKHTLSLKTPPLSSISTPIIHYPHPLVNGGAEPAAASCRSQLGNHGYHTPIPPSQAERLALGLLPYKITIYTTLVLYRTYCAPDSIRKVYCKIDTLVQKAPIPEKVSPKQAFSLRRRYEGRIPVIPLKGAAACR